MTRPPLKPRTTNQRKNAASSSTFRHPRRSSRILGAVVRDVVGQAVREASTGPRAAARRPHVLLQAVVVPEAPPEPLAAPEHDHQQQQQQQHDDVIDLDPSSSDDDDVVYLGEAKVAPSLMILRQLIRLQASAEVVRMALSDREVDRLQELGYLRP